MDETRVKQYFDRIGLAMSEYDSPDGRFLEQIYRAQVTHIPYENIDYLNLEKEDITLDGIFEKIVTNRRGGICYELNTLLGEVLNSLGYEAYTVMADHYRTHMENTEYRHSGLIVKDCDGKMWLSDVGDSFSGALKPLRLVDGLIQYPGNEAYMFKRRDDGSWMLYVQLKGEWVANYAFWEKPASLRELTYFKLVAMNPDIPFTHEELFHIRTLDGYRLLRGRLYCEKNKSEKIVRTVDDSELEGIYALFGLRFPYTLYKRKISS